MINVNKGRVIAAVICIVYFYFPVVHYAIVHNTNSSSRGSVYDDYFIFKIPSAIYLFLKLTTNNKAIPFLVQTACCLLLWAGLYVLCGVLFKKECDSN